MIPVLLWAIAGSARAAPPDGLAGTWTLTRVEGPKESWDYADKVVEWKKFATGRCAETRRDVVLQGDVLEVQTTWSCDEPGFGPTETVRATTVDVQWNGWELIVPRAEGTGRFLLLVPPEPGSGRTVVATMTGSALDTELGPVSWQVVLQPPAKPRGPPRLALSRPGGETWYLEPVTNPVTNPPRGAASGPPAR